MNGYAFIVTNNGYILIHPDLRPVVSTFLRFTNRHIIKISILQFQGILKPAYNRVDMLEVEVMDDDTEPRDFNDSIVDLRKNIVMQSKGHVMLRVKTHLDDLVSSEIYLFYHLNLKTKLLEAHYH